jgi:hypothetical protein
MTPTVKQLKREALAAHRGGDTWGDFWQAHGASVAAAEPLDRGGYHRLVCRLLALVVAGDTAGQYPAGNDAEP